MLCVVSRAGTGHRKKLEQAARLWARGDFVDEAAHKEAEDRAEDSLNEQFTVLAVRPDGSVPMRDELCPFYLWPESLPVWQLFMAVQTQWRWRDVDALAGLDYAGVETVIRQDPRWRKRRREYFAHVCVMERAVLHEAVTARLGGVTARGR